MCRDAETGNYALSSFTTDHQRNATARNAFPVLRRRKASVASSVAPSCSLQNHRDVRVGVCVRVCIHICTLKQTECAGSRIVGLQAC